MSQKSSVLQPAKSVSQVLTPDTFSLIGALMPEDERRDGALFELCRRSSAAGFGNRIADYVLSKEWKGRLH